MRVGLTSTHIYACIKKMIGAARLRAKKKKIPFDDKYMTVGNMVNLLFEEQDAKCYETGRGVTFDAGEGRKNFAKVSPDQVKAGKGYIKGNVRLLCFGANSMKNDMSEEDFRQLCADVVSTARRRRKRNGRAKTTKATRRSHRAKATGSKRR
jgi:hypothetical protein